MILDLFAGPGGWDVGAAGLGLRPLGLELDDAACATRYAAGHPTWQQDVAAVTCHQLAEMRGHVEGLIASPPCQDFSAAGNKAGITGDKGELMWQVPRWVDALAPRWVACEQVPPAHGFFNLFAHQFRARGYSTWVGVLNSADHGVPQTRKRVYLLASLDRTVQPPAPTHCKGGRDATMFDDELLPWVSMATALGWGYDHRGSPTVTGGGSRTGGPEPFGHAARTAFQRWELDRNQTGAPTLDPENVPSPTIVGSALAKGVWTLYDHSAWTRPATTIVGSFSPDTLGTTTTGALVDPPRQNTPGSVKITVEEAAILQGFPPNYPWQGSRSKQFEQIGNAVIPRMAELVLAQVTQPMQDRLL